jgi:hypothetical protein
MNLVFHIVAVLVLLLLVWLQNKAQKQRNVLRSIVRSNFDKSSLKIVRVSWPQVFLGEFADSMGIPFDVLTDVKAIKPRRIDEYFFYQFSLKYHILRIELVSQDQKKIDECLVRLFYSNDMIGEETKEKMREALGLPIEFISAQKTQ